MPRKRRLTIICYLAREEFSPRGIRARELTRALQDEWEVDLVAGPERASQSDTLSPKRAWLQRRIAGVASAFLLDKYELSFRKELRRWIPQTDAALLIGFPFSPLALGSRETRASPGAVRSRCWRSLGVDRTSCRRSRSGATSRPPR